MELLFPDGLMPLLMAAYSQPGRFYHGVPHLEHVLNLYDEVEAGPGWEYPLEVRLALAFHDFICVPGAKDNENKSAEVARRTINEFYTDGGVDIGHVCDMIEMTACHGSTLLQYCINDEKMMFDVDMAILGGSPGVFAEYEDNIAAEYSIFPVELYKAGRKQFLEGLLLNESIYLSLYFRDKLEKKARNNIENALMKY